jgi:hypothetical protein
VGKPDGKRQLGRPRHGWVDNIKMDLREIGCNGMDWINMAQDRGPVEVSCEHGIKPSGSVNARKFLSSYRINGFSRRAQLRE